jgi:hypothetical protein
MRMTLSTFLRLLGVALVATSCRLASGAGILGVFTPGAAARIEITTTSVAGGHALIVTERVDSAQATLEKVTCTQSVVGGSCEEESRFVIPLTQDHLDALFGTVSSTEFQAVRPSYERAGDLTPPDVMHVRLDVTVRERTRTVTWERDAIIPDILLELRCLMSTAGGSLVLCEEVD